MITIDREGAQTIGDMLITGHPQAVDRVCNAFLAAAAGDFAPLAELVGTREVEGADDIDDRAADAAQIAFNRDSHSTKWDVSAAWLRAVVAARCVYSAGECGARRGDGIVCARAPHTGEHRDAGGMCEWEDVPAPAPAPDFREGDTVHVRGWHKTLRTIVAVEVLDGCAWLVLNADAPAGHPTRATARLCALVGRRHFRAGERCPVVAVGQLYNICGMVRVVRTITTVGVGFDGVRGPVPLSKVIAMPLAADWSAPEAVPCEVGA